MCSGRTHRRLENIQEQSKGSEELHGLGNQPTPKQCLRMFREVNIFFQLST